MIPVFTEGMRHEYPLTPDSVVIDCGGFEGNFAAHRNPRRIFLSWTNLWTYIQVAYHELNY